MSRRNVVQPISGSLKGHAENVISAISSKLNKKLEEVTFKDFIQNFINKYGQTKAESNFDGYKAVWDSTGRTSVNSEEIYNELFNVKDTFFNLAEQVPNVSEEQAHKEVKQAEEIVQIENKIKTKQTNSKLFDFFKDGLIILYVILSFFLASNFFLPKEDITIKLFYSFLQYLKIGIFFTILFASFQYLYKKGVYTKNLLDKIGVPLKKTLIKYRLIRNEWGWEVVRHKLLTTWVVLLIIRVFFWGWILYVIDVLFLFISFLSKSWYYILILFSIIFSQILWKKEKSVLPKVIIIILFFAFFVFLFEYRNSLTFNYKPYIDFD
jgi:hypothetical protein